MAGIPLLSGFNITSDSPADTRLVLTKAEMKAMKDTSMPQTYFCTDSESGEIYVYNKSNEIDETTGKFRKFESGAANAVTTDTEQTITGTKHFSKIRGAGEENENIEVAALGEEGCSIKLSGRTGGVNLNGYDITMNSTARPTWDNKGIATTDETVSKYAVTSMVGLGFTANSKVDVADFLDKIRSTYGGDCIVKFVWANANGAYITDGTTTTELISGYTLYVGLNDFNKTNGTWKAGGALLVGSSSSSEVYNLSATVGDTAGTVTRKYVTKISGGGSDATKLNIDGSNGTSAGLSTLINKLDVGTSAPVDNDYYVAQYSNGGTSNTTFYRRKTSAFWDYIKSKVKSFLGITTNSSGSFSAMQIGGSGIDNSTLILRGNTVGTNKFSDINPKIKFLNTDGSQAGALVFSDYDVVQAPASLTLAGDTGEEDIYFIAPNIKATKGIYVGSSAVVTKSNIYVSSGILYINV